MGPWRRHGPGPDGDGVCELEETACGVPALKVLCFVLLGQRNPLQPMLAWPLPAWPCSTSKRPVGAPSCGYCSDDCHMCYETESDVLGGSWGGGGGVPGLPAASPGSHASA